MNYSVVLTQRAQNDLLEIFRYIALELRSEQNALSQLSRLEEAIASLDMMPERYRRYDSPKSQPRNIRIMPVDNYLVFYVPDKDEHKVTVLRVMCVRRRYRQTLRKSGMTLFRQEHPSGCSFFYPFFSSSSARTSSGESPVSS